ncbi:MAG: hypothetical protein DWQ30_14370 [Acidobacteria bacterium]|nr:MAG: hypothetical protein DWQ30_14370 [Acidobacteriota bacterium]
MKRRILAVVVGYAVWTALWLGGNALFFSELAAAAQAGEAITDGGALAGVLGLSFVCSLIAGLVTASIWASRRVALITGALLLLTGIGVQASAWSLMPVWYHLVFLAAIVPLVLLGARMRGASPQAGAQASPA